MAAPAHPVALHPPFIEGQLYRIYNTDNPGQGIRVIYSGFDDDPSEDEAPPGSPIQDHLFSKFADMRTIRIRTGQPNYGINGKFVGPPRPDEVARRAELETNFAEREALQAELIRARAAAEAAAAAVAEAEARVAAAKAAAEAAALDAHVAAAPKGTGAAGGRRRKSRRSKHSKRSTRKSKRRY